jgi:hypothetical protein
MRLWLHKIAQTSHERRCSQPDTKSLMGIVGCMPSCGKREVGRGYPVGYKSTSSTQKSLVGLEVRT